MTRKTAARINRAIDAAVIAMDTYVPQGVLIGAFTLLLVMLVQALPYMFPAMFA